MKISAVFTKDGVPASGLLPHISAWKCSDKSLVISGAEMIEVANGFYYYDLDDFAFDNGEAYVFQCDGGASLSVEERYTYASFETADMLKSDGQII